MKQQLKVIVSLVTILLVLAGCSSKNTVVDFVVDKEVDYSNGKVRIVGRTNIPDNMELILSLDGNKLAYSAQDKVVVTHGEFQSGWFTNNGHGLDPDDYNLMITSRPASVQPGQVQEKIGLLGENLSGDLVVSELGFGNRIKYTYEFSLKSGQEVSKSEESVEGLTEEEAIWDLINGYLATGQYMEVSKLIKSMTNPSNDLQMMYLLAMYHVYGQDGEDEKALESLNQIPSSYTGRNEDLVFYYKYTHESYEQNGESSSLSFNDYVKMYRKNRITPESFAYYKDEQIQNSSRPTSNTSTTTHMNDADYNIYGEYQPVESMTPDEMRAELEAILEQSLPSN